MYAIKFDAEKVNNAITAFYDINGRYPYLICNKKTEELCLKCRQENQGVVSLGNSGITINTNQLKIIINDKEFIEKDLIDNSPNKWNNATILIDQSLKFGEVIMA